MNQILDKHNLYTPKPGHSEIKDDFHKIEWGREMNAGFVIGRTSSPVFFTADGHNVHLQDSARGASVMIVTSDAPKNGTYAKAHTWTVGDACNIGKPNIMTIYENPNEYDLKFWKNPSVLKILPMRLTNIHREDFQCVSHSPSTYYFRRHKSCNIAETFNEETIWHDNSYLGNIFSVIQLAAIMGYRRIIVNRLKWPTENDSITTRINNCIKIFDEYGVKIYNCGSKAGEIPSISATKAFKKVFYE